MGKFTSCLTFAAILLWPVNARFHGANTTSGCKAVPGSDEWPSLEQWKALNESIEGRLLQPDPPGAVCHPEHASYDAAACPVIQAAWFTEPLHSGDPVSSMWNNWNNDTCLPNPTLTCSSDGYPVYVVNATTAEHVKAGVDFGQLAHPRACREKTDSARRQ